jgi:hypothetical protein
LLLEGSAYCDLETYNRSNLGRVYKISGKSSDEVMSCQPKPTNADRTPAPLLELHCSRTSTPRVKSPTRAHRQALCVRNARPDCIVTMTVLGLDVASLSPAL